MWEKDDTGSEGFREYLYEHIPEEKGTVVFPSLSEFLEIIKYLPNWKAAGCDGIYNFFIKKLDSLHECIYAVVRNICIERQWEEDWFYRGVTYLIPKCIPVKGNDFRPITCMSNLYKLTTKCVTYIMQLEVERRGLLSENHLGTVRGVLGAKEQALINKAINRQTGTT
jgi:hypothetical protein